MKERELGFMAEQNQKNKTEYDKIQLILKRELEHGCVVSNLAVQVGREMHLSEEECHNLAVAGFLHDIGKLKIPEYLSGQEDEMMVVEQMTSTRQHTILGAEILEKAGYSNEIVEMVKYHHENCNGTGYPMHLTKEEIPSGARVLRVCDMFAALVTDRPSHKAYDADTAMEHMIEETQNYDMNVFLALMRMVHRPGLLDKIMESGNLEEKL